MLMSTVHFTQEFITATTIAVSRKAWFCDMDRLDSCKPLQFSGLKYNKSEECMVSHQPRPPSVEKKKKGL